MTATIIPFRCKSEPKPRPKETQINYCLEVGKTYKYIGDQSSRIDDHIEAVTIEGFFTELGTDVIYGIARRINSLGRPYLNSIHMNLRYAEEVLGDECTDEK